MKLPEVLLVSAAAGFFAIGCHSTYTTNIFNSYWLFMFSIFFLFGFKLVYDKRMASESRAKLGTGNLANGASSQGANSTHGKKNKKVKSDKAVANNAMQHSKSNKKQK